MGIERLSKGIAVLVSAAFLSCVGGYAQIRSHSGLGCWAGYDGRSIRCGRRVYDFDSPDKVLESQGILSALPSKRCYGRNDDGSYDLMLESLHGELSVGVLKTPGKCIHMRFSDGEIAETVVTEQNALCREMLTCQDLPGYGFLSGPR
ncbi:hypothetical protein KY362_06835 [Candidatus Woesearchaeota archaeon]|nr:hypothetical protein [Candidatus Woesearchaeota archaeon]